MEIQIQKHTQERSDFLPPHPTPPTLPGLFIYLFIFGSEGQKCPLQPASRCTRKGLARVPANTKALWDQEVLFWVRRSWAQQGGPPKSSSLHFAFNGPHFLLGLSKELWARLWAQRVARAVLTVRPGTVSALKRETICVPEPSVSTSWHLMSADWAVAHLGTDQETGTH